MRSILVAVVCCLHLVSFSQNHIHLRSNLPYAGELSNVWGYADSAGNEYALVGWYHGASIVDVSNPDSVYELFQLPAAASDWREIKTWQQYAYATNETGGGLLIADLSLLPDSVSYSYWTADTLFKTAHTLFIDENGILYLFGYNDSSRSIPFDQRGALICELNTDPLHPQIIGSYNTDYVHDGYVRNDTLWAAQISRGNFAVVDVADKSAPVVITTQETPSRFTHNCWLSDDGNYLFTTDERSSAFITSYDVSDLGNITEIDRWQAHPGSGLIPHNTYFVNNFLVTSYYKYGFNIIDATNPAHLVETGSYDTSPFPDSSGFAGCWGVYPYLPSGNILASDMQAGLFVFTPEYVRGCYLSGVVTDVSHETPQADVSVEIMTTNYLEQTGADGSYKTGTADPGLYDVRFYRDGCLPKIVTGVDLQHGVVTTLNVALTCTTYVSAPYIGDENEIEFIAAPSFFDETTTLSYHLAASQRSGATLKIFNGSGYLLNAFQLTDTQGEVIVGEHFSPGIYIVRLEAGSSARTLKLVKLD